ncbi:ABC transporter substrate-binding protein [Chelatococcus asaccharovorans]|uniref:Peptide/nickel transport system substrate-binding protein n=1 Tax=Chelatococcus asaccharovorans TaxID=28210 RepID=A0A2V3UE14_9HYPH|nr:ABC transporter substrate-binding protein [Chelatococcus asaccharovorans]MBS7706978.1 ABC transporter substrate-binding protein [Chelatococcus asaccharovorans]PXW63158.1 peptide/nickel transport system substrate-binding protein [Chelatococcus asaccharovorans]CAH1653599.1 Peptide/nickel transport system substrate-binding protein [Chelatococcus asaccharovorans]CAH1694215.1 Peptide/nickel transport system substrate-binding protein [Chelatococcus asaccharovorans]
MVTFSRRHILGGAAAAPFLMGATRGFAAAGDRPNFTIAVADLPATLEPARELSNVGTRVTYSIFDTLIRRDFLGSPDGGGSELKPHLATKWERVSPSELIVTLRQGVKFHNGDELTADDVAYTFRDGRLWGDKAQIPSGKPYFGVLSGVEPIDRYTVRFRTKVPDVLLEQRLASWCAWIVNKRAYEEMGFEAYSKKPVATGPYRVVSHSASEATVLDAFDDYFMGRPTAKRVTFKRVPELAARVAGLVAGDYDLITNIPPDQMNVVGDYKDIDVRSVVLANVHVIAFNESDKLLSDKRVRQALASSINRQQLVDSLWQGTAVVPASHNFPEYGQMFVEGRKLPFDPVKAKALLKEAGYNGEPIVYRTQANYYTNALEAGQILIEQWKAVGINASLQVVENSTQLRGPGAQIFNWSNSTRLPDPLGAIWVAWGPDGEIQSQHFWKSTDAFNKAGRALEAETDPAKRKALFTEMLDIWEDEAPATILYQPSEAYAIKKSIAWRPTTFYFMDLRPDNLSFGKV